MVAVVKGVSAAAHGVWDRITPDRHAAPAKMTGSVNGPAAEAGGVVDLIGKTPVVELKKIAAQEGCVGRVFGKLEMQNPCSSVKDRIARKMIESAEREGKISPGVTTIIEPGSGNTGIGLAFIGAAKGYKVILTMPDCVSVERRMVAMAHGAEVVLTPGDKGADGVINKAREIAANIPDSWIPNQFENPNNPLAHYETTGPELMDAVDIDVLVAGVGTGGTITGTGRYIKERKPEARVVAVEPLESAVLSGGAPGAHGIMGIGPGFVPAVLDTEILDEAAPVSTDVALETARRMATTEGLFVGMSSGAAVAAALRIAKRPEMAGKNIVCILPSSGERYLSTPLCESVRTEALQMTAAPM